MRPLCAVVCGGREETVQCRGACLDPCLADTVRACPARSSPREWAPGAADSALLPQSLGATSCFVGPQRRERPGSGWGALTLFRMPPSPFPWGSKLWEALSPASASHTTENGQAGQLFPCPESSPGSDLSLVQQRAPSGGARGPVLLPFPTV